MSTTDGWRGYCVEVESWCPVYGGDVLCGAAGSQSHVQSPPLFAHSRSSTRNDTPLPRAKRRLQWLTPHTSQQQPKASSTLLPPRCANSIRRYNCPTRTPRSTNCNNRMPPLHPTFCNNTTDTPPPQPPLSTHSLPSSLATSRSLLPHCRRRCCWTCCCR